MPRTGADGYGGRNALIQNVFGKNPGRDAAPQQPC
jgi:hypothetical protein